MSILSFAKRLAGTSEQPKKDAAKPKKTEKKTTAPVTQIERPAMVQMVGLEPLISEKSVAVQHHGNVITFRVRRTVSKSQIVAAFREQYGVTPLSVRTVAQRGKRRRRGRTEGSTSDWKKAYVQLPVGKSIDVTA